MICDTANDVDLVVQLLGNDVACIATVLHAVVQGSYLVFTGADWVASLNLNE